MNQSEHNKKDDSALASVGILMLETNFPRILGDIGHPDTWNFPVLYKTVRGASAFTALSTNSDELLAPFIVAAKDLVMQGAAGITTSCGFLSLFQAELKSAIDVPVATSSLMQVPWVQSLLPKEKQVGVLTIHAKNLTAEHLLAAGAPTDTPIKGTENGHEFTRAILADKPKMDLNICREDNLAAASMLMEQHPNIGAIVLECTNIVPYASDIQKLTGVPVFSVVTLIKWFQSGLIPQRFSAKKL